MIELYKVGRDFLSGTTKVKALDDITLEIQKQEFIAITGPSGSGKSSLLSLLAGLDRPTRGRILIDKKEISAMSEKELSLLRGKKIGFVFQNFQLISTMTALENVKLPAEIRGDFERAQKAEQLLKEVQLEARANHYPHQLSGGEKQRVAIARASIHQPQILLADEPTGNLDSKNGKIVIELLKKARRYAAIVLVTHNSSLAQMADREIILKDGKISKIIKHKQKKGL